MCVCFLKRINNIKKKMGAIFSNQLIQFWKMINASVLCVGLRFLRRQKKYILGLTFHFLHFFGIVTLSLSLSPHPLDTWGEETLVPMFFSIYLSLVQWGNGVKTKYVSVAKKTDALLVHFFTCVCFTHAHMNTKKRHFCNLSDGFSVSSSSFFGYSTSCLGDRDLHRWQMFVSFFFSEEMENFWFPPYENCFSITKRWMFFHTLHTVTSI